MNLLLTAIAVTTPGLAVDTIAIYGENAGMTYPGGKAAAGVYQRIINLMPPHSLYIEPFLGGGAIMKLKKPADTLRSASPLVAKQAEQKGERGRPGGSGNRGRGKGGAAAMAGGWVGLALRLSSDALAASLGRSGESGSHR